MKNISSLIITTLLVLTAGCSLDESAQTSITDNIDPLFARELQRRGYISDARNITQGEVSGITELDLSGESSYSGVLVSLRGIEYFESLQKLDCSNNYLLSIDLSRNKQLMDLRCRNNRLKSLDVSQNTELVILDCSENMIRTRDVSANKMLTRFTCRSNRLETLDIRQNTALTYFECSYNRGIGNYFPVSAWFSNNSIPKNFQTGSWNYYGRTVTVDYW